MTDFNQRISELMRERLAFINANREPLVEAWIAQHGFNPDGCELVQQDMGNGTIRMWVEMRGEFAELQGFRVRERLVQDLLRTLEDRGNDYWLKDVTEAQRALREFGGCGNSAAVATTTPRNAAHGNDRTDTK